MQDGPPRRRRARPVADTPVDELLLRSEDLTKGWLLALLEQAPLNEAPGILASDLTRDGPRIFDAVVRALASEDDLRRISRGGVLEQLVARTGELAGAGSPEAASRAVDAVQAVVWSALRAELGGDDADLVSALSERLALVAELVRGAVLRGAAPLQRVEPAPSAEPPLSTEPAPRAARLHVPDLAPVGPEPSLLHEPQLETVAVPPERPSAEALWISAVEDEITRSEQSDAPLSLLLVELDDADRVRVVEPPHEAATTFGRFAQSLRTVLRRQDILACETESRAWIIARDTGRSGALSLASRAAQAVGQARPWRGAPMTISAGLAVLGEDGRDAGALIDAAEQSKWAAAASGLSVVDERSDDDD